MNERTAESLALRRRYIALMPFMKYLYFLHAEERYRQEGSFDSVFKDLEEGGKLLQAILKERYLSKPHDLYRHIRANENPSKGAVQMASEALMIAEEMSKRCCYLFDKQGKLELLKFSHPFFIRGKKDLRWWVALLENKELSDIKAKESFDKWLKTTDFGKRYAIRREFYQYAMRGLQQDENIIPHCVIKDKWFKLPKGTKPRVKE